MPTKRPKGDEEKMETQAPALPEVLGESILAELTNEVDSEELPTPPPSPESKEEKDAKPR